MWTLLSIAILVIITWVTIAIFKCYKLKNSRNTYPIFTRVIKNDRFPVYPFKDLAKHEDEECTICKQAFLNEDEVRVLDCTHFYHKVCIDEWFQNHQFCCVCKKDFSGQEFFFHRIRRDESLNALQLPAEIERNAGK
jgi:hypothetical protein